ILRHRDYGYRSASHHRSARVERSRIHADYLACLRRLHSILPRQPVDAIRRTQRGFFQSERAIQLRESIALVLHELDLVAILNGLEVLPRVSHDQQEKAA